MRNLAWGAAAVALAASAPLGAWDGEGHMIIAARAWDNLTPESQVAVGQLLRHNPSYARWTANVAPADQARAAFIRAATWPDDIKNSNYHNDGSDPSVAGANRNSGYDDCNQHKYWHYEDFGFSPDNTAFPDPPLRPNAETQINAFTRVLADGNASDQLRSYDLVWLIHLVGDVHQPLHATARFLAVDNIRDHGDDGGNDVRVTCSERRCSKLHSYWDGALDASWNSVAWQRTDYDRAGLALPASLVPDPAAAANRSPRAWLLDSSALARANVYQPPIGDTLGPFAITNDYRDNAARIARGQAVLAGARLANLINRARIVPRNQAPQIRRCVGGRLQ
jgi:hypothetical protein